MTNEKQTFTPGPWMVHQDDWNGEPDVISADGTPIVDCVINPNDAHLISAAPDLLEALEELLSYWEVPASAWDKARAAIAKARNT